MLASTNFFLLKQHIRDYQQEFTINKKKRKAKCKTRENLVIIFQNVDDLMPVQISSLQIARFLKQIKLLYLKIHLMQAQTLSISEINRNLASCFAM